MQSLTSTWKEISSLVATYFSRQSMDADVISIETARSVYDIHSPRVPSVEEIVKQIKLLLEVLPKEQLWINPDCGLKTRKYEEVKPSLQNMVTAVKILREELK